MAMPRPLIHCVIDPEPTTYHQSDVEKTTVSFAANLSLEWPSDGSSTIEDDEPKAEQAFKHFLSDLAKLEFHRWRWNDDSHFFTYVGKVTGQVSETNQLGDPKDLLDWLQGEAPNDGTRYWSTFQKKGDGPGKPTEVDVQSAGATHRLRAAHTWNAPVGHKFRLTHILRADANIQDTLNVILPYFGSPNPADHLVPVNKFEDPYVVDLNYDSLGSSGPIACRTSLLGTWLHGPGGKPTPMPPVPLDPATIDPPSPFTSQGFLKVDGDADNLRRLTRWFEDRAASLMATGTGLSLHVPGSADKNPDADYLALFRSVDKKPSAAAAWYVVAALCTALDPILIGTLKPVSVNAEGEILAPLVTALLDKLRIAIEGKLSDETAADIAFKSATVLLVVRDVIKQTPLAQQPTDASRSAFISELRYVHDIKSTPDSTVTAKLLNALLDYYDTKKWTDPADPAAKSKVPNIDLAMLASSVAEFEQNLHGEQGAEKAIVRFIETKQNDFAARLAKRYVDALKQSDPQLLAAVTTAANAAWNSYRTLLTGPFNGAEAMRRAASSEFTTAALRAIQYPEAKPSSRQFCEAIEQSDFYSARLLSRTSGGCFRDIVKCLPIPPDFPAAPPPHKPPLSDPAAEHLQRAYAIAVKPLSHSLSTVGFIPDSAPHPLAIQIAANIDGAHLDEFGKHFNGIAVAVRRLDAGDTKNTDRWAHANLADLTWDSVDPHESDPNKTVRAALHPMLPAVSDGRGPMFIEYQGLPFADTTFSKTMLPGASEVGGRTYRSFYRQYAADYDVSTDFEKVPALAYGRTIESYSFVISNGGALPLPLQVDPKRPWMPSSKVPEPYGNPREQLVDSLPCQRRTAIGQMAHEETNTVTSKGTRGVSTRRIGAPIEGVAPLATDYPRIGLFAETTRENGPTGGVRDIFREASGLGSLVIGSAFGADFFAGEWELKDVRWTGTPKQFVVRVFDGMQPSPDAPGPAPFPLEIPQTPEQLAKIDRISVKLAATRQNPGEGAAWTVTASVKYGDQARSKDQTFTTSVETLWLRLCLDSDSSACMSFADPSSNKTGNVEAPLLLIATPESDRWKADIPTGVASVIHAPRVGYLDLERWIKNDDLLGELFHIDKAPGNENNGKIAGRFKDALLCAYAMRHLDQDLAANLDRLPDPAVEKVRIELIVVDQLTEAKAVALSRTVDLFKNQAATNLFLKVASDFYPIDPSTWTHDLLNEKLLKPLLEAFTFTMSISGAAGAPTLNDKLEVTLPGGLVATISIDALVPERHFTKNGDYPPVMHEGLLRYATRRVEGSYIAFPDHIVRTETMLDGIASVQQKAIGLAADMIAASPVEQSRRYDIVTRPGLPTSADQDSRTRQWRLLGEIDVSTQRWRPTGKPHYHFVDPNAFVLKKDAQAYKKCPALPLILDGDRALSQFEAEAFFDRLDIDAQTITQKLLPLPSQTVLQQHVWDAPSATYFRHRFTLRSRYAGALRSRQDGEASAWDTDQKDKAEGWTMRVALRADLSRMLLTRPQLRALIPLTTSPSADEARRPAPPILGVLQEPPFARGGLADRIAAEIKTGFGYGFPDPGKPPPPKLPPVEIRDSRKEIGPSPFLDYLPLNASAALGTSLMAEGPLGLTFDQVDASGAAFPNSMVALSPFAVAGDDITMEEYFVGVSMRRYIDPAWIIEETFKPGEIPADRCCWIEFPLPQGKATLLTYLVKDKSFVKENSQPLILVDNAANKSGVLSIQTTKLVVDGVPGFDNQEVEIAQLASKFTDRLVILHQPVAPGRYSTSVLARPNAQWASIERGRSNSHVLLASFEWSPPKDAKGHAKVPAVTLIAIEEAGVLAKATMASTPTTLAWTKTSRDFDFVHSASVDYEHQQINVEPVRVKNLFAIRDEKANTIAFEQSGRGSIALCSSTLTNKFPIHLHRHLSVLTTSYLSGPGRPIEMFRRSAVFTGKEASLAASSLQVDNKADESMPENNVRIIEFETPASILCGTKLVAIPDTYKTAYFDLLSTGFKVDAKNPTSLRMLFRFVGSPAHLRKFKQVTIFAWNDRPKAIKHDNIKLAQWVVDLKNGAKGTFSTGLEMVLLTDGNAIKTASVALLRSDGSPELSEVPTTEGELKIGKPDNKKPGFFVALVANGSDDEFWTDVSLLHSRASTGSFDFSWLFSEPGGADPATEITPKALGALVEAQARIVSVSPPIPVMAKV